MGYFGRSVTRKIALMVSSISLLVVGLSLTGIIMRVQETGLSKQLESFVHLQILLSVLLVIFLTLLVVLVVRLYLTGPLRNLHKVISSAEEGDFLSRVVVKSDDEVGRLATDFNRLLTKLTDVQASRIDTAMELDEAQRELEMQAALEAKNRQIELTNRKLTRRINELDLLFDVSQRLTSSLELDHVLQAMAELIGSRLGFQRFSILLFDEAESMLTFRHVFGPQGPGTSVGDSLPADEGLVGRAIQKGTHELVSDLVGLARNTPLENALPTTGSFLCVPMQHREKLYGVLNFTSPKKDAFSDDAIQFMTALSNQAAMAIANAQLFKETLDLSVTDELTKLANRRQMKTALQMEFDRARRFSNDLSVIMIDIDHFKRYNDANGHLLGDQVLTGVARVLENNTRKVDTVARFGGEEFVIILPGQDKATASSVAEKLRKAVAQNVFPRMASQPNGYLSITAGVSCYPKDGDQPQALVDMADLALYVAKRAGRNRVVEFEKDMLAAEAERQAARQVKATRRRRRRKPVKAGPPERI